MERMKSFFAGAYLLCPKPERNKRKEDKMIKATILQPDTPTLTWTAASSLISSCSIISSLAWAPINSGSLVKNLQL